MLVNSSLIRR